MLAATPRRCSASAPRSASFITTTGAPCRALATMSANGTSRQPRFGAVRTVPSGPHDADDGNADPDQVIGRQTVEQRRRQPARSVAIAGGQVATARSTRTRPTTAPQADDRGPDRVDGDVQGEDDRAIAPRADDGRGPARRSERRAPLLTDEACCRQLADQATDRPARQPGPHTRSIARAAPRWSSLTIVLRFARRTVPLRCPIGSRPTATGLCSSCSNSGVDSSIGVVVSSFARGSDRRTDAPFRTEESRMDTLDGRVALVLFRPVTEISWG